MEPTQNNQQQYPQPEPSFNTTPPPTPSIPPTEPIPPKGSKKLLLIIVGLVFTILIGIGLAYLIFGKENNPSNTKQVVPTDQTNITNKSTGTSQPKKITEWGMEVPTPRTPNMIYKISTINNTETLLLSSKELKDLISTKCPDLEEDQQYPVAITRYPEALPATEEGTLKPLGPIGENYYYMSFSKESCSSDSNERILRLYVYNDAGFIRKIQ